MQTLKRSLVIAVGMLALALTLTLTSAGQAVAQGMKPLLVSVINTEETPVPVSIVSAYEPVQLAAYIEDAICPGNSRPVRRILPDGTTVEPFSVPAGRVLVVTDLGGVIEENVPWSVGIIANLSLSVAGNPTLLQASTPVTTEAVDSRILSMNAHLQSGALIGAESLLCVSASTSQPGGFATADVRRADLRGYLIPD